MPRIARIVGIGYPHHIIQRGNNRQDIFFDQEDRRLYLKWLEKYTGFLENIRYWDKLLGKGRTFKCHYGIYGSF